MRGRAPRGVTGELSLASVYVSLLPVVEACVVVAVPGRVGVKSGFPPTSRRPLILIRAYSRAVLMPQRR